MNGVSSRKFRKIDGHPVWGQTVKCVVTQDQMRDPKQKPEKKKGQQPPTPEEFEKALQDLDEQLWKAIDAGDAREAARVAHEIKKGPMYPVV